MPDRQPPAFPLKNDEHPVHREVVRPVEILLRLLKEEEAVTPITPDDKALFHRFFCFEGDPQYSKSWAYLTQAVNGVRLDYPFGLKYHYQDILIPIGYFPRPATDGLTWHFHLVRPMGNWVLGSDFLQLCQKLRHLSRTAVYIKKLTVEEASSLQRRTDFKSIGEYAWHPRAIEEDDTFEEVIVDTNQTLCLLDTTGANQVKDHYQRFLKRYGKSVEWKVYGTDWQIEAWAVVQQFFKQMKARPVQLSIPSDYTNMISSLPLGTNGVDYFAYLLYINGQHAGFCLAERLCESSNAGVYANIALRDNFPYSSEYLIVELLRKLQNAGITTVNFGGSETSGLHHFKLKFRPVKQQKMHWVVYDR